MISMIKFMNFILLLSVLRDLPTQRLQLVRLAHVHQMNLGHLFLRHGLLIRRKKVLIIINFNIKYYVYQVLLCRLFLLLSHVDHHLLLDLYCRESRLNLEHLVVLFHLLAQCFQDCQLYHLGRALQECLL